MIILKKNNLLEIVTITVNNNKKSSYNITQDHEHIIAASKVERMVRIVDGIKDYHILTSKLNNILINPDIKVKFINTNFQTNTYLIKQYALP